MTSPKGVTWHFQVERAVRSGVPVCRLSGRLGSGSSAAAKQQLTDAATGAGRSSLVVDLSGLDYMSSGGFKALEFVAGRLASRGRELVLCNPIDPVRLVLRFFGPRPNIVVEESFEQAIERALNSERVGGACR